MKATHKDYLCSQSLIQLISLCHKSLLLSHEHDGHCVFMCQYNYNALLFYVIKKKKDTIYFKYLCLLLEVRATERLRGLYFMGFVSNKYTEY